MPSADVLGVIIGILFIIPTIYFIRTKDWDKVAWPFPYHIACLLHAIRRACDGWNDHSDRVLIRITVYSYRSSGLAHALKGGTPRCRNSLVKPRIL